MENTKICSKCGRELPLTEYYKSKWNKDGFQNYCKECCKQHNKQFRIDNPTYMKDYNKQYSINNTEYEIERRKRYYGTINGYCHRLLHNYIVADKKQGRIVDELPSNYVTLEFLTKAIQQACFYNCGETDWHNMGIDRLDNSKPHTIDNVVPCCTKCNRERGTIPFEEFCSK